MKRHSAMFFALALFPVIAWTTVQANAQDAPLKAAQSHAATAKALAYEPGQDLTEVYDGLCRPALSPKGPVEPALQVSPSLADRKVPPRSQWYTEPVQAFDNLYYIGSTQDSTWAVKTSEGIIVVDTGNDYSIKELSDGLKKFKLDPAQIKYAVLSHAHGDRYWGAKFLQDTYHTRILMSAADWDVLTKSNEPNELKPKKDMIITDSQKLTLGDTTITMYLTPGHTPGTVSTIVPLKDGNDKHVGVIWGGMAPSFERYGVRYYSSLQETFSTWIASLKRFQEIADNAHADVYLAIHPHYDRTIEKLHAIGFRKPGGPHPYVDKNVVDRFLTIMRECTEAQLTRIKS
jgi:metallo-beta-lactamase class B